MLSLLTSGGVDGSDYMPGLIGLNNIKNTDFVNVVIQWLARGEHSKYGQHRRCSGHSKCSERSKRPFAGGDTTRT